MTRLAGTIVLLALALVPGLTACATLRGRQAPAPVVHLDTPPPPPRVVIPQPVDSGPPTADQPAAPPQSTPPAPLPAKPAPPPRTAEPPAAPPAPATEPPAPVLQTTTNVTEIEQLTLRLLIDAQRDLDTVSYRDLSPEARAHYDRAVGLIGQARSALRIKNYLYADQCARNAASLARQLRKVSAPIAS